LLPSARIAAIWQGSYQQEIPMRFFNELDSPHDFSLRMRSQPDSKLLLVRPIVHRSNGEIWLLRARRME